MLLYVKRQTVACFSVATLIFNPLAYAMLVGVGWRVTYSIFAVMMFVIGCAAAATFRYFKIFLDYYLIANEFIDKHYNHFIISSRDLKTCVILNLAISKSINE